MVGDVVVMNAFEHAAADKIKQILANPRYRCPDGSIYIAPQICVEVAGKERLVNTRWIMEELGLESVDLNYWREAAKANEGSDA